MRINLVSVLLIFVFSNLSIHAELDRTRRGLWLTVKGAFMKASVAGHLQKRDVEALKIMVDLFGPSLG